MRSFRRIKYVISNRSIALFLFIAVGYYFYCYDQSTEELPYYKLPDAKLDVPDPKAFCAKADFFTFDIWKNIWNTSAPDVGEMEKLDPRGGPLRVFVLPHTHLDPGWLKTFEEYHLSSTKSILSNLVKFMSHHESMKFIWTEISFLHRWWESANDDDKKNLLKLLASGQLEITGGGWVMPDEAITMYTSLLDNLLEGHDFVNNTLHVQVLNNWAVDPFGHAPAIPFIYKWAGIDSFVVERIHYRIKMFLRKQKSLVFKWRQLWDTDGSTDAQFHMLPSYSYTTDASCGPDKQICEEFTFQKSPADFIKSSNQQDYGNKLANQYRRLAAHFKESVILIPVGTDFAFINETEWISVYNNYEKLFQYMREHLNIHAQFGTLNDYFNAINENKNLVKAEKVLSGDLIPYSDREKNHWVGYFTSHPFMKRRERELAQILRSANILMALSIGNNAEKMASEIYNQWKAKTMQWFESKLSVVRRNLALFQHHDAITGTSKKHVMDDYAQRLFDSFGYCKEVMSSSIALILEPVNEPQNFTKTFLLTEDISSPYAITDFNLIQIGAKEKIRIVVFNSLTHSRVSVVRLRVTCPNIHLSLLPTQQQIPVQINPVFDDKSAIREGQYEMVFIIEMTALSLVNYETTCIHDAVTNILVKLETFMGENETPKKTPFEIAQIKRDNTIELNGHNIKSYHSGKTGLLQSIFIEGDIFPLTSTFGTHEDKGGAYLFRPSRSKPGGEERHDEYKIWVIRGPICNELIAFGNNVIFHHYTLYTDKRLVGSALHLDIKIDINNLRNVNFAMRIHGDKFKNTDNHFFTDINGLYLTRREYLANINKEANYYPMASSCALEGAQSRITVLSGQPAAVTSVPASGMLEILLDRVLSADEGLGLNEALSFSPPSLQKFVILFERIVHQPIKKLPIEHLSLTATILSRNLLTPFEAFVKQGASPSSDTDPNNTSELRIIPEFSSGSALFACDIDLVNIRPYSSRLMIILHRRLFSSTVSTPVQYLDECKNRDSGMFEDSLTYLLSMIGSENENHMIDKLVRQQIKEVAADQEHIEPMQINAYLTTK